MTRLSFLASLALASFLTLGAAHVAVQIIATAAHASATYGGSQL